MLKRLSISFVAILMASVASAQFATISHDTHSDCLKILQIENLDSCTLLYMQYRSLAVDSVYSSHLLKLSDQTFILNPSTNHKYHLLSSLNMPVFSEAVNKYLFTDSMSQQHQFILQFERIPNDCTTFNIVCPDEPDCIFNFSNVSYNPDEIGDFINIYNFIKDFPVKELGYYFVNGKTIAYMQANDIVVHAYCNIVDNYGKYFQVCLSAQNYSNRPVLFDPAKVSASGFTYITKKSKRKPRKSDFNDDIYNSGERTTYNLDTVGVEPYKNLQILSAAEYDKNVKKKQQWNSFWISLGESMSAVAAGYSQSSTSYHGTSRYSGNGSAYASAYSSNGTAVFGYSRAYGSSYTTAYGYESTSSYDGLATYMASQIAAQNILTYNSQQREIRQQLSDGYVKKHTIYPETEYSGYLNIKHSKKLDVFVINFKINGIDYSFYL